MANTNYYTRTNHFRVTSEEAYRKYFRCLRVEDLEDFTKIEDGVVYHGFGGYSYIEYCDIEAAIKDVYEEENGEVFDENGDLLDLETALKQTELYDQDGHCIFDECDADSSDELITEIQKLLPDGECFILQEIVHEKLRFVDGFAVVATNKEVKHISLSFFVDSAIKELVGKDNKVTRAYW